MTLNLTFNPYNNLFNVNSMTTHFNEQLKKEFKNASISKSSKLYTLIPYIYFVKNIQRSNI